jgi:ketosteroid isomerase-like protein
MRYWIVAGAATLVVACNVGVRLERDREELAAADRAFADATSERGVDGWVEYFAEDGSMVTEGGMVTGPDSIRALMGPAFGDTNYTLTWDPVEADVSAARDLGYTRGRYLSQRRLDGGLVVNSRGTYVTIWKRQDDRSWKVVLDIGTPDGPSDTTEAN